MTDPGEEWVEVPGEMPLVRRDEPAEELEPADKTNPLDRLLAEHEAAPWTDSGSGPGWLVCQHLTDPRRCEKCTTPDS